MCLVICMTTKEGGVHLELALDLSIEAFLDVLCWFVSRVVVHRKCVHTVAITSIAPDHCYDRSFNISCLMNHTITNGHQGIYNSQ